MRRIRTFRISDDNYEAIRDFIRNKEQITKDSKKSPESIFKSKKDFRDIVSWCYYNHKTLEDIQSAFEKEALFDNFLRMVQQSITKNNKI